MKCLALWYYFTAQYLQNSWHEPHFLLEFKCTITLGVIGLKRVEMSKMCRIVGNFQANYSRNI